jgi:hypothetical protein
MTINTHTHTRVDATKMRETNKHKCFTFVVTFVAEGVWVMINWKDKICSKIKLTTKDYFV